MLHAILLILIVKIMHSTLSAAAFCAHHPLTIWSIKRRMLDEVSLLLKTTMLTRRHFQRVRLKALRYLAAKETDGPAIFCFG